MRKEILWVAAIGIVIGLIVAFGFYRVNSSFTKNPPTTDSTPTPKPNSSEFKITLDKPDQDDVVTNTPITVSGITKGLAWITVSGESGDYTLQADEQGVFSQDVDLIAGVNQIKITAFDPTGSQSTEKVLVVFSSSFQLNSITTPNPDDQNTTGSAIRQKVAEKVNAAMNKPKAYIGTVTDIADSTIQIKTSDSQIEQISTSDSGITVVSSKGNTTKNVKLTDIAIGDFIVAMGYVNGNSVLLGQRILVTDPIDEPKIDVAFGKVTDTSKKNITVTGLKDSTPVTVTPDKNTDLELLSGGKSSVVKLGTIGDGDMVIYVTDNSGTSPVIRSVFVVQKSQS